MTATSAGTFQHEALLHEGDDGFLAAAVPFVREGVAAEEPVLVAVGAGKIALLRAALGEDAGAVGFADMRELGHSPGRILPAWHDFLYEHRDRRGGVRGIGEPIWPGRTETELIECQLHESLLNLAFADADGFRLLCTYDVDALEEHVLREARGSHPAVHDHGVARVNPDYRGDERLLAPFDAPLPPPEAPAASLGFGRDGLAEVRRLVAREAGAAGVRSERAADLVLAASEIAANSLRHGRGRGILRVWREGEMLVCDIHDRGQICDPLAGRHLTRPGQSGGWGLWLAHQVCDLVQVRSRSDGTVVRLRMRAA